MGNVVALRSSNALDDLANKINVCVAKLDDYRATTAIHLAEAKALCKAEGITFKDWVAANIKLSYTEAVRLSLIGAAPDPAQMLADLRKKANERKIAFRNTTPTTEIIEDEDVEEESAPGELPNSMRIRGFMHRAKEAAEMAMADDLAGIKITNAMRTAASNAAKAWIELLAKLEGE
jgi:hypothetical protein